MPYTSSLKWKPASENSIDFRLNLHFPIYQDSDADDEEVDDEYDDGPRYDYEAMPDFELSVFEGNKSYSHFGTMYMTEQEWADMKSLQIPLDDTIVECAMDQQKRWRFLRFRDDKKHGNHISVVKSVLESIEDAVGQNDLLNESSDIRAAWKRRLGQNPNAGPGPGQQRPPQTQQQVGRQ